MARYRTLDYREALKSDAVAAIEEVLSTIEKSREPDLWERVFLVEAISSIFRGAYGLARVNAAIAMTPPQDRCTCQSCLPTLSTTVAPSG